MPDLNQYGVSVSSGSVGDRQTASVPTPNNGTAPIQARRWIRNGKAPSVELQNALNAAANYASLYRTKEVFSAFSFPNGNPMSTTLTTKWRFSFHSGPLSHAVFAQAAMLNPYASGATQAKATLKIYSDVAETTLVGSVDFYYGPGTSTGGFGWRQGKYPIQSIELSPDTDYYGRWDLSGYPNLLAVCVWDMPSMTQNFNGYLTQSLTSHSPVLGIDRSNVHTLLRNTWKRGGSKILNYVVHPGSHSSGTDATEAPDFISNTTTSTTFTNILDRSSTTISSSTPGWTVDLRNKDRVSQTSGVPVVMKAFGRATSPASLEVVIKNSAGTTLATASTSSTTNTWFSSGQFNAPAALDKLDIQFRTTGAGRAYLYAASIFEYEA